MSQSKVTRCSVCRLEGHTKRTCSRLTPQPGDGSAANRERPIIVRVLKEMPVSEHRIELTPKPAIPWDDIPVFREETPLGTTARATVNFAKLVTLANEKNETGVRAEHPDRKNYASAKKTRGSTRLRSLRLSWPSFHIAVLVRRLAVPVGIACILLALPFPAIGYYQKIRETNARVVEESTRAFLSLQSSTVAAFSSDIRGAEANLAEALNSFANARSMLEKDHGILLTVAGFIPLIGPEVESRQELLVAGQELALGNTYMVKGIDAASRETDLALTDRFQILRTHLRGAVPQYREALLHLQVVDQKAVPVEYQETFADFKVLFGTFINDMEETIELIDALGSVFGEDVLKRYLIVFQNHHEARPTGGFMGSFALLDVQKGKVAALEVPGGGTYDLQGQLDVYMEPPVPLQLVNGRWEFQDANWFPDFAESAKKIEWFYTHGRGRTVDGVIAINASVLERFLRVVGPVQSDAYDLILHHEDALTDLQDEVENTYDREVNQPKAVIAELLEQFLAELRQVETLDAVRLLSELHEALEEKEIQVYAHEPALMRTFRSFGWTGELLPVAEGQDYLSVIHTNIAGQKSDARIEQTIEHKAVISGRGEIVNTVVIRRTHTGQETEPFYGAPNISYVRLYVPEGAELIAAGGFTYPPEEKFHVPEAWYAKDGDLARIETNERIHVETGTRVTEEFGKTVFGNWVVTNPGETSDIYFTYRLPFRAFSDRVPADRFTQAKAWLTSFSRTSHYTLIAQKQSGSASRLTSRVIYPEGWQPAWKSRDEMNLVRNGAETHLTLETDAVLGLIMEEAK